MSIIIEKLKKDIIGDDFIEKVYLTEEQTREAEANKEKLFYDDSFSHIGYKKVQHKISDEEFDDYIKLKTIALIKGLDKNINAVKLMISFWFALTIIGIVIWVIILSQ